MRAKAWFVVVAPVVLSAGAAHAAWELATARAAMPWLGALIALATLPLQLGVFFVRATPRTSRAMPVTTGVAAGAAVLSASAPGAGIVPIVYALGGLLSVLAYVFWSTDLDREEAPSLSLGGQLPVFPVHDENGAAVDVSRYRGGRVLFLFYRGNWCPLCMAQVKELAGRYRELEARGVKVVLVSPQPDGATRSLARKLDVHFDFLVDRDAAAARMLGILHAGGTPAGFDLFGYDADTVLPTAILVGEDGRILFADQTDNYRVRPEPDTFLRVLDGMAAADEAPAAAHAQ